MISIPHYGLIGGKLGHSYSQIIHEHFADYRYALRELAPEDVEAFVSAPGWRGLNVTIPYKETVIPFCAHLSESARRIGAVNTLYRDASGAVCGTNTDYYGFMNMLALAGISVADKKVLLLGSGGTGKTAQIVLSDLHAREIVRISRQGENNYRNLDRHSDAEVIVNTTPVGMFPHNGECRIDLNLFPRMESVIDVIYNPLCTELLLTARDKGLKTANGLTMLVAQAVRASEFFLNNGTQYNDEVITETTNFVWHQTRNIVLIGMPGCGKSTIGAQLAQTLNREFIDTDDLIEKAAGRTIPEIFSRSGEKEFREIERKIIAEVGKLSGKIIAPGGGAISDIANRHALQQNATIVYLRRPIEKLATAGRPLSQNYDKLRQLAAQRLPVYEALADWAVDNDTDQLAPIVARITAWLEKSVFPTINPR